MPGTTSGERSRLSEVIAIRETPRLLFLDLRERGITDATVLRTPAPNEPELVSLG